MTRKDAKDRVERRGMIRAHHTRQTAITNSTPPVRDNYRTGRETTRADAHPASVGSSGSARKKERSGREHGKGGSIRIKIVGVA